MQAKKRESSKWQLSLFHVIPLGLEPKTYCLEGSCSIQLSYGTIKAGAKLILFALKTKQKEEYLFFGRHLAHVFVFVFTQNKGNGIVSSKHKARAVRHTTATKSNNQEQSICNSKNKKRRNKNT